MFVGNSSNGTKFACNWFYISSSNFCFASFPLDFSSVNYSFSRQNPDLRIFVLVD